MTDDLQPQFGLPFAKQLDEFRLQQYVKTITGFAMTYTDLHPEVLTIPAAIDWFIGNDSRLQREPAETIALVREQVLERARFSRDAVLCLVNQTGCYGDSVTELVDSLPEAEDVSYIATDGGAVKWDNNPETRGYYLKMEP